MNTIIVIGAGGTIGKAAADRLAREHEVIRVGFKRGDHLVALSSKQSILEFASMRSVPFL